MATVRELITVLGFDLQEGPLKRYEKGIESAKHNIEAAKTAAFNIAKAFAAVGAAGGGLFFLVKHVAELGDNLGETAQKLGINAEALQKFQFIAKDAGVDQGVLNGGIKLFSKNIGNAIKKGEKVIKINKNWSLSLRNQNGQLKTTDQLMLEVADKFKAMADGPEKAAAAQALFGRAGSELIPFLNMGGSLIERYGDKLKEMGLILGDDVIKSGDDFMKDFGLAEAVVASFSNMLGAELLPTMHDAVKAFLDWADASSKSGKTQATIKKIADGLKPVIKKIVEKIKEWAEALPDLIDKLGGMQGILDKIIFLFEAWIGLNLVSFFGNIAFAVVNLTRAFTGLSSALGSVVFTAAGWAAFAGGVGIATLAGLTFAAIRYGQALRGNKEAIKDVLEMEQARKSLFDRIGDMIGITDFGAKRDQFANSLWNAISYGIDLIVVRGNKAVFDAIGKVFSQPIKTIEDSFANAWATIKTAGLAVWEAQKAAILSLGAAVKSMAISAVKSLSSIATSAAASVLGFGGFVGPKAPAPTSSLSTVGPGSVASAAGGVTNNQDVQVASNVTVNVTSQADPKAIADTAASAVKTAWNNQMRQAQRALQQQVV
jgi:hypothetical protein